MTNCGLPSKEERVPAVVRRTFLDALKNPSLDKAVNVSVEKKSMDSQTERFVITFLYKQLYILLVYFEIYL